MNRLQYQKVKRIIFQLLRIQKGKKDWEDFFRCAKVWGAGNKNAIKKFSRRIFGLISYE